MTDWSHSAVYKYVVEHMHDGCCYPWPFATADKYGVSIGNINAIVNYKTWREDRAL